MNATALPCGAADATRGKISKNLATTSTPNPTLKAHGVRRVGRSLVQFVRQVNYVRKPTVFWHLADDPTLDRDGIEAQPPLPPGDAVEQAVRLVEAGVARLPKALTMGGDRAVHVLDDTIGGSDAKTTLPAAHVELIDVAEVLLQSPPYTRPYTRTGGEP
jgi:hypothetical protein